MSMEPLEFNIPAVETPLFKAGVSFNQKPEGDNSNFAGALAKSMKNLKDVQLEAGSMMKDYASGKQGDVSQVMLAMEKSDISTKLAIQVRNRVVEGYKQIMNMQM